ncbi:hypothetical protein okayama3_07860 [Yersinia pseudotuberculosis]|uniref:dual specificity protein phosphatase family protein n=1 Tax=Yersinia pseudotuberculosis complex TaxID=1649845 RepID=UPI00061C558E|nr:dual specificity protein phosphatase [Yersinia similis]CNC20243.1 Predicted protein tyrosine phosphatase [Yersinia similis]
MIEIYPNLVVGNETDAYAALSEGNWFIVHACKEPFHRQALGYSGRAVSKSHPEYLIARRDNRLILNLIDADNPAYIPKEIISEALVAIHQNIQTNKVLVHCNQGMSRSPTIALLYLLKYTDVLNSQSLSTAIEDFRRLYPIYNPARGVTMFVEQNWHEFARSEND